MHLPIFRSNQVEPQSSTSEFGSESGVGASRSLTRPGAVNKRESGGKRMVSVGSGPGAEENIHPGYRTVPRNMYRRKSGNYISVPLRTATVPYTNNGQGYDPPSTVDEGEYSSVQNSASGGGEISASGYSSISHSESTAHSPGFFFKL